jgi:hypothetical protein
VRLLLLLCLVAGPALSAAEAPKTSPAPAAAAVESPQQRETRQYVARLTEERNQLREQNDALRGRQGLLLVYGALLTLLSGWLMFRALTRPAGKAKANAPITDAFPAETTAVVRKNATITIRNGSTQQAEVTEQVQTRRAFARGDTAAQTRQPATRTVARNDSGTTPPPVVAPELEPSAAPVPSTTRRHAATRGNPPQAPATVRVEQQSDRLAPVEVAVKPGTAPVRR